jgi:hypothetical protein
MMLSRRQFIDMMGDKVTGVNNPDHIIWSYEKYVNKQSKVFFRLRNLDRYSDFYMWCADNIKGDVICYSSDRSESWWGLTDAEDSALFALRWLE